MGATGAGIGSYLLKDALVDQLIVIICHVVVVHIIMTSWLLDSLDLILLSWPNWIRHFNFYAILSALTIEPRYLGVHYL
jgi:hypothetical protein